MMMRYSCCDEPRRLAVEAHATLNGIDYLEVLDRDAPPGSLPQRTLLVHCLKPLSALDERNVVILGGERVRDVKAEWAMIAASLTNPPATAAEISSLSALPDADRVLVVRTDSEGDFSTYTLRLQRSAIDPEPPPSFDPQLAEVEFTFKVECPTDFDCGPRHSCAEPSYPSPDVDYLAKDYSSFRRLMLDRLAQVLPDWSARTPADLGVTLVELLAYAGDQLSYFQDAVATEAYLATARRRTSLRRHAVLVDYAVHEGSNARTWVQLQLATGVPSAVIALEGLQLLTRVAPLPARISDDPFSRDHRDAFAAAPTVFEPMDPDGRLVLDGTSTVTLFAELHEIQFYTWGQQRCCLPSGATRATLAGHLVNLAAGDVLLFEELVGPLTGELSDADPSHRHAVRLTAVRHTTWDSGSAEPLVDPLPAVPPEITEIEWDAADALPFPLCISSRTDEEHGRRYIEGVSVARGNVILADHGRTVSGETLEVVPKPPLRFPIPTGADRCDPPSREPLPVRYRPSLRSAPLTHAGTVERVERVGDAITRTRLRFDRHVPAARALDWNDADVLPVIRLTSKDPASGAGPDITWEARRDLLSSAADDDAFVVESEADGTAFLRFGDDEHGRRPEPKTSFTATYRIGQGLGGNVGAGAIAHVVSGDVRLAGARNPLPARGGTEPETAAQIRRRAPEAYRTQQRAVTPDDYARVVERFPGVQRAAARQRWTGSWHTMFIAVDLVGGEPLTDTLRDELETFVEPFRMAGHEVALDDGVRVSLELEMTICVRAGYSRSDVQGSVLELLGTRQTSDGRRGLFHPDALSFGQAVYLSPIYAAVRSVPGVESVEITAFGRQGQTADIRPLREGVLTLGRLEIPRLDNDRNFPEHGVLRLALIGGQ
jgi:hypothetical protein